MKLLRSYLVTLLFVFLMSAHYLQAAPSLEDYGALPTISQMAISPDGKAIAFRKHNSEVDLVTIVSLETGKMITGLDVSEVKPRQLYFLDDSRLILVASEVRRMTGYRGKNEISTAFIFDLKSGNLQQLLTPGDVIFKGQLGLGRIVGMSNDGRYVFMPAFVGDTHFDPNPRLSLIRVDLTSPRSPKIVERGSNYSVDYFLDGDGNLLAQEQMNSLAKSHSIIKHRDNKEWEIYSEKISATNFEVLGIAPGFDRLVVSTNIEGRVSLQTQSLEDGAEPEVLFARKDADVEATLRDINQVVHGVIYSGFHPSYEFFNPELTQRMANIVAEFPEHSVWLVNWSPDWKHLVVKVEGVSASGDYYLYSPEKERRFLTTDRPNISAEHINPIIKSQYKARDGLPIPVLLTVPASRSQSLANLPAVVLPHGGPFSHDWAGFDWLPQALANRGYLVVQPQFRGSTGFGVAHWDAGRGEWGKKMQDDLSDGLDALVKAKLIDPERVCIAGMSYGGYAALAGGAFEPRRYKCVISINGVSDIPSFIDHRESAHGRNHWLVSYWHDTIAKGETSKEELKTISPASFADQFQAPVLLIHGDKDLMVDYDQAKLMQKRLKKAKKPVYLVKLKNEDHYLSTSESRTTTLNAVLDFVDRHIGEKTAN